MSNFDLIRWIANPGPQTLLFQCGADIILYGGAAGGGKTDALLIDAARGVDYSGYRAIIFRRTYKELEKHIIERSHELYGTIGKYNEKKYRWSFKTKDGGRSFIYLAYLESDKDVFKYHGAPFQFIGFDESCMFSLFQVRFMLTRLRRINPLIPKRMLLCSNPLGPGFGFHKQVFIEDAERGRLIPGKKYRNAKWPDNGEYVRNETCFIPASIYDNPVQLKADPNYINNLKSQGGALARVLLKGSWDETISMAVQFDNSIHVIDPIPIPEGAPKWIGIDWGKDDRASAVWQTSFGGRVYWYRDLSRPGQVIRPFAEEVLAASVGENISFIVLSHETWADRGMGHTQADQFVEIFSKAGIPVVKSDKDPEGRLMLLREFLRWTETAISEASRGLDDYDYWQKRVAQDGEKAWREYAQLRLLKEGGQQLPRLQIFRRTDKNLSLGCPYVIQTLPLLTVDLKEPKKIAKGQDDHGFDAGTYGLKGYVDYNESNLMKAYIEQIGGKGKMPDSSFAAEFAMDAAKESLEAEHPEDQPFRMGEERFEYGSQEW